MRTKKIRPKEKHLTVAHTKQSSSLRSVDGYLKTRSHRRLFLFVFFSLIEMGLFYTTLSLLRADYKHTEVLKVIQ